MNEELHMAAHENSWKQWYSFFRNQVYLHLQNVKPSNKGIIKFRWFLWSFYRYSLWNDTVDYIKDRKMINIKQHVQIGVEGVPVKGFDSKLFLKESWRQTKATSEDPNLKTTLNKLESTNRKMFNDITTKSSVDIEMLLETKCYISEIYRLKTACYIFNL